MSYADVNEKIERPCFMFELDNIKVQDWNDFTKDQNMKVRIYYFPSKPDKNKIENLKMIDSLNDIFVVDNTISITNEFVIEIWDEIEADIIDKVVHYYIPIMISEEYERIDNVQLMKDLKIRKEDING